MARVPCLVSWVFVQGFFMDWSLGSDPESYALLDEPCIMPLAGSNHLVKTWSAVHYMVEAWDRADLAEC
jgi:hypothetical protein